MNEKQKRRSKKGVDKRNYGIDALRLVAMLCVVILHILGRGGGMRNVQGQQGSLLWLIEIMAYCAVNCYGIISGYVSFSEVKKEYHYEKYISMWIQVFFYSVAIMGVAYLIAPSSIKDISLKTILLPVTSGVYWYFTAYTGLFFLIPWLNCFVRERTKREMNSIILGIFLLFSCYPSVVASIADPFKIGNGYSFLWLMFLYLIGAWMKKCRITDYIEGKFAFIVFVICEIIMWRGALFNEGVKKVLVSYISPTMVIVSICCVIIFSKWRVGRITKGLIKCFAPAAFGVYLIHVHILCWNYIEEKFLWITEVKELWKIPLSVVESAGIIFIGCLLIEKLRLIIFSVFRINNMAEFLIRIIGRKIKGVFSNIYSKFAN